MCCQMRARDIDGDGAGGQIARRELERFRVEFEARLGDGSSGGAVGGGGIGGGDAGAPVPDDVGDGSDDDIIARQLREAAMAEEDPELREKLWQEYRDYKASIGGGEDGSTGESP